MLSTGNVRTQVEPPPNPGLSLLLSQAPRLKGHILTTRKHERFVAVKFYGFFIWIFSQDEIFVHFGPVVK